MNCSNVKTQLCCNFSSVGREQAAGTWTTTASKLQWFVCLLIVLCSSAAARSQGLDPSQVEVKGKLAAWQENMIKVVGSNGEVFVGVLNRDHGGLNYSAELAQGFIKPGMFVRFRAPLGDDGSFFSPVNHMTVFIPDPALANRRLAPVEMSHNIPGVYPVALIEAPAEGQSPSPETRFVGVVRAVETDKMLVQCGERPVQCDLAENARFDLTHNTLELAQMGDQVDASGIFNPTTGQLTFNYVNVRAAKPLEPSKASESLASGNKPGKKAKATKTKEPKAKMVKPKKNANKADDAADSKGDSDTSEKDSASNASGESP